MSEKTKCHKCLGWGFELLDGHYQVCKGCHGAGYDGDFFKYFENIIKNGNSKG